MDRLKGKVVLISGGEGPADARLFVAEGARVVIGDVLEPEGRQLERGRPRGGPDVLDDARREAQAKGATRISAEPSFGDPAEEIITAARDRQADLVVVGSRGHGRLVGLLLGSVTQRVISLAHCPVVVVR